MKGRKRGCGETNYESVTVFMWEMMAWTRLMVVEVEKRGRKSDQQPLAVCWMQEMREDFGPAQQSPFPRQRTLEEDHVCRRCGAQFECSGSGVTGRGLSEWTEPAVACVAKVLHESFGVEKHIWEMLAP